MADAPDSKSGDGNIVWVQVPPPAPTLKPSLLKKGSVFIMRKGNSMDLLAIGEILIDLTQEGQEEGIGRFAAYPGGAPANVAVAAARLGAKAGFIGKVGRDGFGRLLCRTLLDHGVDASHLAVDALPTTLAVVSVDEAGDRSFSFYRGADGNLMDADISDAVLREAKICYFGSVSMTVSPAREAILSAARRAKAQGCLLAYDPNYRESLWESEKAAVTEMKKLLPLTDILKVSEEEFALLTGTADLEMGSRALTALGISLVLVTLGEKGAFYRFGEKTGRVAGVPCVVGDTNGAGDSFFGAVLARLAHEELAALSISKLEDILRFANRAASITTSRRGAIPAMPYLEEVEG